ncbi:hypothetical protein NLJ89_g5804 [Agrocybe chaxingu]|uniref:Uncharacterized protein n=1 Tax=Agrocybe chaxingu TaxID=84603 RepID=A0A9W8K0J9_9AGAR|nr:hypothetical protein NLJ89_g5804 [Agrocybe chaxingu]
MSPLTISFPALTTSTATHDLSDRRRRRCGVALLASNVATPALSTPTARKTLPTTAENEKMVERTIRPPFANVHRDDRRRTNPDGGLLESSDAPA